MIWCLREAISDIDRDFLARSMCTTLFRDERHGRLALRFSAIDADLNVRHGRLGQRKHFGTGALAITNATRNVMIRAMTARAEPPPSVDAAPPTSFVSWGLLSGVRGFGRGRGRRGGDADDDDDDDEDADEGVGGGKKQQHVGGSASLTARGLQKAGYNNLVATVRMVAVDCASDEINSVRDMRNPSDGSAPLAPNLELIGRDKAH
eukprot:1790706-Pyramimonas_sp.AAC.1